MILVVYIFLQGWRATLIPLLAVPVSLIGTFMVFPLLGFSINTLSLFGLVLAIGLVVDDAIVVVEAVEHHIEEGMTPLDASLCRDGTSGEPGDRDRADPGCGLHSDRVYSRHHRTSLPTVRRHDCYLGASFSAFNALTLSPALCALLLKPKKNRRGPLARFFDWFNRVFKRTTDGYVNTSGWLVRKSIVGVVIILVLSVSCRPVVGAALPGGFLPTEDQGYAFVALQLPQGTSLQRTSEASQDVENALHKVPGVQSVTSVIGFSLLSFTQDTYHAFYFVYAQRLGPAQERRSAIQCDTAESREATWRRQAGSRVLLSTSCDSGPGEFWRRQPGAGGPLRQRRSPTFLTTNTYKFLGALKNRPEIAAAIPSYCTGRAADSMLMSIAKRQRSSRSTSLMSTRRCRPSWAARW